MHDGMWAARLVDGVIAGHKEGDEVGARSSPSACSSKIQAHVLHHVGSFALKMHEHELRGRK